MAKIPKIKASNMKMRALSLTGKATRDSLARRLKANGEKFARGMGYKGPVV